MALVLKDRVQETTTTTGTSDFVLGGAVLAYQSFSVIGNTNTTFYTAFDSVTGAWEVGIGTYSTTGPTLTRDTILASSAGGAKVSFAAGQKNVFSTYPAERSVNLNSAGTYITPSAFDTVTANTATLTAGTISTTPSNSTDIVNKQYVDTTAAASLHYHSPVYVESPNTAGNLNATYNQPGGPGVGVGATLTNAGTKAALTIDGILMTIGKRVLIYNQTNGFENGVYTVTTVGTPDPGGTNWVLTRATDADTYAPSSPNSLGQGDAFFVTNGNTGAGETYVCNTTGTITFGTTAINFVQISSAQVYSAGTGLNLSPATTFNISNTGVTAATYGAAGIVPVIVVNAQGQITSATNTAIAISAGAVSGLAPSATTDTTNASNITSGTLPTGRISGSYTGLTGVGTLTAGTWNASTIGAQYGGTGQTSYTTGDILYASNSSNLTTLADVATGNALISGGVGVAPSYGKIGLTTHVSGILPVANGGTGSTSLTANNVLLGNGTSALQVVAPGTNGNVLTSDGTTWVSSAPAGSSFPAGTRMLFAQTSAPTGWTKDTTNYNNHALRVVTGSAATGGTVDFTTAFASQTPSGSVSVNTAGLSAGATTLSTTQIPAHTHTVSGNSNPSAPGSPFYPDFTWAAAGSVITQTSSSTGGGSSHSHSISGTASASFTGTAINLAVKYLDVITATKT